MTWRPAKALIPALSALLLLASPARGGTGVGVSEASTLDTRPPEIALIQPQPAELLLIGSDYLFLWTVTEDHFAAEVPVLTFEILVDGVPLFSLDFEAEPSGEYAFLWTVAADSSVSATWRISAVDDYGNPAASESEPFYITVDGTGAPLAPPDRLTLAQNFPNPFNPTTTLRFALPEAGHVRLHIYDVRGRGVARILDETRVRGWHSVEWDARGRSSGIYFARLETEAATITRKLVLLR
jgi:hypothetical protein